MTIPQTGSLGLSGKTPSVINDRRITPGESSLLLRGKAPFVIVDYRSLAGNLPALVATFTERRRIIRDTTDDVRDVTFIGQDLNVYLALELNGEVFDAADLSSLSIDYKNSDESVTGTIDNTSKPGFIDLSVRLAVRGKAVNIVKLNYTDTLVGSLFDEGVWTMDVYGVDADHVGGAIWGSFEVEYRRILDGLSALPNTGMLTLTGRQANVRYDRPVTQTGALTMTGITQPPVVTKDSSKTGTGTLTLSGQQASVSMGWLIAQTGSMSLSGVAPIRTP